MPSRGGNSFLCCNIWKNKPQPFLKWVKRHYLGKGSPKGNFAKVISLASEQETFPEDANLDITISSLQTRYACSETIQTATNRWKENVKTHNKNSFLFSYMHPSCIVQRGFLISSNIGALVLQPVLQLMTHTAYGRFP